MPWYPYVRPKKKQYKRVFTKKNMKKSKKDYYIKKVAPTTKSTLNAGQLVRYIPPIFTTPSKYIKNQIYNANGFVLTGAIGSIPNKFFSANGVQDPDITHIGHQPIGFDQIMTFYEHYCVFRSKITVTFHNASAGPMKVMVYLTPDTTPLTTSYNIIENGYVQTGYVEAPGSGGSTIKTLSLECDVKKYFGKSKYKDLMDQKELTGDINANPTEQVYFVIAAFDSFGPSNDPNLGADVTISYDTIYFEPKKVPSS